ncbi:hypothetical protein BREVNS_1815 [Brevinematales bacterium NS]|nr:DUF721 domain-containing protein [Brevinematales bacterium]QJR22565.1 hypothetical protein BREVNS_1815 [Brevinematales bacterium NS]
MGGRIASFGDVIKQALNRSLPYGNVVIEIREVWDECVGVVSAKHTLPVRYANEELTVLVDDSYWMSELKLYEQEIKERLGRIVPYPVQRIIWKLVKSLPSSPAIRDSIVSPAQNPSAEVPADIREKIEASVKRLEDRELQEAMKSFFLRLFSMQQMAEKEEEKENERWR